VTVTAQMALAAMLAQLAGWSQVAAHALSWPALSVPALAPAGLTAPSGLIAVAAIALAGIALAVLAGGARIAAAVTASPLSGRATALRRKSWAAAYQRLLNPDAAGHARPRAPSAAPAAA
jgi:Family of unknown function (DUF6412)